MLSRTAQAVTSSKSFQDLKNAVFVHLWKTEARKASPKDAKLPLELWVMIFKLVGDPSNQTATRDLHALTLTCRTFYIEAEKLLYRCVSLVRVNIFYHWRYYHLLMQSIQSSGKPWRAHAVRSLHVYVPMGISIVETGPLFMAIVNLVDLELRLKGYPWSGDPRLRSALLRAPFRLRAHAISAHTFCHIHEGADEGVPTSNVLATHTPHPCLSSLSALTLAMATVPFFPEADTDTLLRCCSWYNITHLNLTRVASWLLPRDALRALGQRLVSFRLALGTPETEEGDGDRKGALRLVTCAPFLWPTTLVRGTVFPRLRHLEVYEDYGHLHGGTQLHPDSDSELEPSTSLWRDSCPAIRTLVWRPSPVHPRLGAWTSSYENAVLHYTEAVFDAWPTLERFERPRFVVDDWHTYTAYALRRPRRPGPGRFACWPEVYDRELWRKA